MGKSMLEDPMRRIPFEIRRAIGYFTRSDADAYMVESGINEVREYLNEWASKLSVEQVKEMMNYIAFFEEYLNEVLELHSKIGISIGKETSKYYSELGIDLGIDNAQETEEKESVEIEYTSEQKFCRGVLADYLKSMSSHLEIPLLTLKALDIAKEELGKYLPENYVANGDNKVLHKVNHDVETLE